MPTQVLMPALSPTMEEGKLAKWVVKEGDAIKAGDVIAEIETDKATMEVEAVDEGRLGKILVGEGTEGVKVNTPIAVILGEGEDASALQAPSRTRAAGREEADGARSRGRETPRRRSPAPEPGDDEGGKKAEAGGKPVSALAALPNADAAGRDAGSAGRHRDGRA